MVLVLDGRVGLERASRATIDLALRGLVAEASAPAAQGIMEEVLELLVPGLVLACALPTVGPLIAAALRDAQTGALNT